MNDDFLMLAGGAASVAFFHTLIGPDHYLPFVALGKARGWSLPRTAITTIFCGIGHSMGSILLGLLGVYAGRALADLQMIESLRGNAAAWALVAFGLIYCVWGLRRSRLKKPHSHMHTHGNGLIHSHSHNHLTQHAHIHEGRSKGKIMGIFASVGLFVIFALGPCETLIPLMMIPAAKGEWIGMALTVGSFTFVTVATMTTVVVAMSLGLKPVKIALFQQKFLGKYAHAFAGGTVSLCGIGIITLGL